MVGGIATTAQRMQVPVKGNDALLLLDMNVQQLKKVYISVVGSLEVYISIQSFQRALYRIHRRDEEGSHTI